MSSTYEGKEMMTRRCRSEETVVLRRPQLNLKRLMSNRPFSVDQGEKKRPVIRKIIPLGIFKFYIKLSIENEVEQVTESGS